MISPRVDYTRQIVPAVHRVRLQSGGSAGRGIGTIMFPRNYGGNLRWITTSGYLPDSATMAILKMSIQTSSKPFLTADVQTIGSPGVGSTAPIIPPNPEVLGAGAEQLCFKSLPLNQPNFCDLYIPETAGIVFTYDCVSADISTIDVVCCFDLELKAGL